MHLTSVDLFTGIGGFTLAFHGVCTPLVYCDVNPVVLDALDSLMKSRKIPRADVVIDVRSIDEIKNCIKSKQVDILTASFPCVAWSSLGNRVGLGDNRSSLFFDAVKVINAVKPTIVMFENVPRILTANGGRDVRAIIRTMYKAGYTCRWTTCSANEVGLPQMRTRWFCLCIRRDARDLPDIKLNIAKFGNPPVVLAERASDYSSRYFLLGNSIVPAVAQLAFARMYTGFKISSFKDLTTCNAIKYNSECGTGVPSSMKNNHGMFDHKGITTFHNIAIIPKEFQIHLDPSNYKSVSDNKGTRSAEPILTPIVLKNWPTPRAQMSSHSNYLSKRSIRDLPTVALFATKFGGRPLPKPSHEQVVNPRFVEWLMGYPADYTKL